MPIEPRRGRVLAHGFPLTEFGGFHGPSSANSKPFHGSEFQLVKDRGNNKNSSSIFKIFVTFKFILCFDKWKNKWEIILNSKWESLLL